MGGTGVEAARDIACCRTWYKTMVALGKVTDKVCASANRKTSLGLWLPPAHSTMGLKSTRRIED